MKSSRKENRRVWLRIVAGIGALATLLSSVFDVLPRAIAINVIAFFVGALLSELRVEAIQRVLAQNYVWVPIVFFALVAQLILIVFPDFVPDEDFFDLAAQIIPIFLLAMAFESRVFLGKSDSSVNEFGFLFLTLGLLLVGELAALLVSMGASPTTLLFVSVAGALSAGGAGVLVAALVPQEMLKRMRDSGRGLDPDEDSEDSRDD